MYSLGESQQTVENSSGCPHKLESDKGFSCARGVDDSGLACFPKAWRRRRYMLFGCVQKVNTQLPSPPMLFCFQKPFRFELVCTGGTTAFFSIFADEEM